MKPIARVATQADLPMLVELSRQMVALLPVGKIAPFHAPSALATFQQYMNRDDAILLFSGTGYILGVLAPMSFNHSFLLAQEIGWFETSKGGKVLLDAYESWARSKGALAVGVARIDGARDKALDRIYKRLGYNTVEHHYIKAL